MKVKVIITLLLITSTTHAGTWTEDFANLGAWEIYNFKKGAELWQVSNGVVIGEIFQPGFMSLLLVKKSGDWRGYNLSCKAQFSKIGNIELQIPEVGLVIYSKVAEDTRYVFSFHSNGFCQINRQTQGNWQSVRFFAPQAEAGVWFTLKGWVSGRNLHFSINDFTVTVDDNSAEPLLFGQVGLVTANARVMFDDVIVKGGDSVPDRFTSVSLGIRKRERLPMAWGSLKTIY